jgi:hypothetical protein
MRVSLVQSSVVVDQKSGSRQSKELDCAKKTVCDFKCAIVQ